MPSGHDHGRRHERTHNDAEGSGGVSGGYPAGASAPQELLVPTPGQGHYLSLHDAFATGESFAVVYDRYEGTVPFDGDMADTLRVFDVASKSVTEIYSVRGHEWNLADVTAGGGLVSATKVQTLGVGCRLLEATGGLVARPGFPSATPACFDETTDCPAPCPQTPPESPTTG